MNEREALDIMNSDYKLWEEAETKEVGNGVVEKTINLPWGIGDFTLRLEGIGNAEQRRAAVNSFGEYVRATIDERINDEAVTARAKAAVARSEPADNPDSAGVIGGEADAPVPEADVKSPSEAHTEHATKPLGLRAGIVARRAEVKDELDGLTVRVTILEDELRELEACLTVLGDDSE